MRRRSIFLGLPAAALSCLLTFLASTASGQQQPIFGCRHAISCRPSPVGNSALNDFGASGLLVGGSIRWGPGFHFGLAIPILNLPAAEPEAAIDAHGFHLRNVTLLPTPEPDSPPSATPTPPPDPR